MPDLTFGNFLMLVLVFTLLVGFLIILHYLTQRIISKKKAERSNTLACKKALRTHAWKLKTDYFWSDYMRFAWIMLFIVFFIALGFSIDTYWSIAISFIVIVIAILFLRFAIQSYKNFPVKAAACLAKFEEEVRSTLKNEISFKGDNIQVFSNKDNSFDTKPQIFSFPTEMTKVEFPPFQKNAKKQPIIKTKKLEFLILSREYFSICQGAATFKLLDPDRAGAPKQCAELPGRAGECHEHYYSQMRNVEYDGANECIRIIYYDERDDVEFPCKKINPDRKDAIKALQEKLRLTERQRLHKIDEHQKYEEILNSREKDTEEEEKNSQDNQ